MPITQKIVTMLTMLPTVLIGTTVTTKIHRVPAVVLIAQKTVANSFQTLFYAK